MKRRQHQRAVRTALAAMFWLRQNEREAARLADTGMSDDDINGPRRAFRQGAKRGVLMPDHPFRNRTR